MRYTVPLYSLCVSFDKKRLPFYFLGSASGLDCHVLHWHALPVSASLGQISKDCGTSSGLSSALVLLIPGALSGCGLHLLRIFAETRSTVALGPVVQDFLGLRNIGSVSFPRLERMFLQCSTIRKTEFPRMLA